MLIMRMEGCLIWLNESGQVQVGYLSGSCQIEILGTSILGLSSSMNYTVWVLTLLKSKQFKEF